MCHLFNLSNGCPLKNLIFILLFLIPSVAFAKESDPAYTNRLIHEQSPYLLQHAHNPVDWYPWGQEAFDKAKKEDKPIFLSIGYSPAIGVTSWNENHILIHVSPKFSTIT